MKGREDQGSAILPVALKVDDGPSQTCRTAMAISPVVDPRRDYLEPNHHQALDIHDTIE